MAKTTQVSKNSAQDDVLKKRKKSAKKEAKVMLRIEQAKKDVHKAEQKIQKAQDNLKTRTDHLHDLEESLHQLQTAVPAVAEKAATSTKKASQKVNNSHKDDKKQKQKSASKASTNNGQVLDAGDSYENSADIEALHLSSPEPAEGRVDLSDVTAPTSTTASTTTHTPIENIPTQQPTSANNAEVHSDLSIKPAPEDITIKSGGGSMPVETNNAHAWPPPAIREELADAIAQEAVAHTTSSTSPSDTSHKDDGLDENEDETSGFAGTHRSPRRHNTRTSAVLKREQQDSHEAHDNNSSPEDKSSDNV
ncbi:hypothetical protein KDW_24450 [Dictyobacter vulcani]|uniref:Uncharacterized protein n=1 Tax=Dictyobacter vulcani TaxID=2607529 RepID=A0A5J4KKG7_9CHLR|nr:hypothetical protein [Dictyobacter vulcani]GER88283.1 hypothetical protein KDW_24450 [Dictyobacter vulcani]